MLTKIKAKLLKIEAGLHWKKCTKIMVYCLIFSFLFNLGLYKNKLYAISDFILNLSLFGFGLLCGMGIILEADRRKANAKRKIAAINDALLLSGPHKKKDN